MLRGIPEKNAAAHRGEWMKSAANSYEVRGKTLGIVGYGNIGMQLGVIAEGLGMVVEFYDVVTKLPLGNARQIEELETLLGRADVVSLHVPQLPSTANMIGAAELAAMKPGAVLINASRGNVVEIDPLVDALRSGALAGAAIDVFPVEPSSNQDEFVSPLRGIDTAILTPHIGGSTVEAQENIGTEVATKLARYSDNGTTLSAVNFPEVALPEHEGQHRLLHVHRNVPGIMSAINQVFSENEINICAQYLQTRSDIGYVVIDVESDYSELALSRLSAIEGTLRCRVLF
jgi:D-3-phosphoglycerate dehydrogenase